MRLVSRAEPPWWRRLLVPALMLAVCAAWRASYVPLVSSLPLPPVASAAGVLAALWVDAALLGALLLLARLGVAGWCLALLLAVLASVVRIADRIYYFYSGGHIDRIALQHLQGDATGMQLDAAALRYAGIAFGLALLAVAAFAVWARRTSLARGFGVLASVALASLAARALLGVALHGDPVLEKRVAELSGVPEIDVPVVAVRWLTSDPAAAPDPSAAKLHPVVRRKLRKFGIALNPVAEYPLVRERVYERPLKVARTPRWRERPNVIVLFFESFSAELTSVHGSRYPGLTPNLEDFARHALVVDGFFNSSTPTVMALSCTYCSYLPVTNTTTWFLESHGSGKTRLYGLPHILGERGWQTTHVHTLDNAFVRTGEALERLGFREIVDGNGIGAALRETRVHWGFSDSQMFRYLVQRFERGLQKEPFLLSAATIDSHAPFRPTKDIVPYKDGAVPLLNAVHTADAAFGTFWRWFRASPFFDSTIVVVLADHAMFPGKEHADARPGDDITGRYYDATLCAIYDPCHELRGRQRIVSGQIDVTPTLLHLLGINVRNHFEGLSLFEGRPAFPELIGMHEFLFMTYQRAGEGYVLDSFKLEDVESACAGAAFDPQSDVLSRCEYLDYYRYKKALHVANRVWPGP